MWLKINGCDFNTEVAALTLSEFKLEFEHSYCKGKTEKQISETHKQLAEHAAAVAKKTEDGNITGIKKKSVSPKGQGNGASDPSTESE